MEDITSGNDQLLLTRMKALARREAMLRQAPDGGGVIEEANRAGPNPVVAAGEFARMLGAGWLRPSGEHTFVLSRRGIAALRAMLNRPAESCGTTAGTASPRAEAKADPAKSSARAGPRGPVKPIMNDRESPLAWLRQRRDKDGKSMIGDNEFLAGERLRADFERAHLNPRVTASWDPTSLPGGGSRGAPGVGMEQAEGVVAARQRVDAALQAVGPELAGMLLDVCCFLKGLEQAERNGDWPRRAGKVVLQLGLAHLARHYGFARQDKPGQSKVRSWGTADFRPHMDSGEAA